MSNYFFSFSMFSHFFKNTHEQQFSSFLREGSTLSTAKHVLLEHAFRNFFILKICSFMTLRFYFSFQIFFIIDRFAIKFFSNISNDFISNSIIFNKSSSSIKKYMHLVCPSKRFTYALLLGSIICNGLVLQSSCK